MIKALAVCGTFSETVSLKNKSRYMEKLFNDFPLSLDIFNGGAWSDLQKIIDNVKNYKVIFWFPSVSNDNEKLLPQIKQKNLQCILISSKNNIAKK